MEQQGGSDAGLVPSGAAIVYGNLISQEAAFICIGLHYVGLQQATTVLMKLYTSPYQPPLVSASSSSSSFVMDHTSFFYMHVQTL